MPREYFCAYHSYLDAMEQLTDAERGRLFTACLIYSSTGEVPQLRGNERFVFPSIRSQIDRDIQSYEAFVLKQSVNGKKGGRPRKANESQKTQAFSGKPKKANEKEKEKEKEKENISPPLPPSPGGSGPATPSRGKRQSSLTPEQNGRFVRFWTVYPRKQKLAEAEKAWSVIDPDEALTERIVAAVRLCVANDFRFREERYIPLPASWLNGAEWENQYGGKPDDRKQEQQPPAVFRPSTGFKREV